MSYHHSAINPKGFLFLTTTIGRVFYEPPSLREPGPLNGHKHPVQVYYFSLIEFSVDHHARDTNTHFVNLESPQFSTVLTLILSFLAYKTFKGTDYKVKDA